MNKIKITFIILFVTYLNLYLPMQQTKYIIKLKDNKYKVDRVINRKTMVYRTQKREPKSGHYFHPPLIRNKNKTTVNTSPAH